MLLSCGLCACVCNVNVIDVILTNIRIKFLDKILFHLFTSFYLFVGIKKECASFTSLLTFNMYFDANEYGVPYK